jgi:hypothetical protein
MLALGVQAAKPRAPEVPCVPLPKDLQNNPKVRPCRHPQPKVHIVKAAPGCRELAHVHPLESKVSAKPHFLAC